MNNDKVQYRCDRIQHCSGQECKDCEHWRPYCGETEITDTEIKLLRALAEGVREKHVMGAPLDVELTPRGKAAFWDWVAWKEGDTI